MPLRVFGPTPRFRDEVHHQGVRIYAKQISVQQRVQVSSKQDSVLQVVRIWACEWVQMRRIESRSDVAARHAAAIAIGEPQVPTKANLRQCLPETIPIVSDWPKDRLL
jgi:hypothetical protein